VAEPLPPPDPDLPDAADPLDPEDHWTLGERLAELAEAYRSLGKPLVEATAPLAARELERVDNAIRDLGARARELALLAQRLARRAHVAQR
jgi:hypothetical protein